MPLFKLNKSVHKWLSVLVGGQLLIWLISGLYFNLMDHSTAGGNEFRQSVEHNSNSQLTPLIEPTQLNIAPAQSVNLLFILGKPFYQVVYQAAEHDYQAKHIELFDAVTGQPYMLEADMAERIALASYAGNAKVVKSQYLKPPIDELVNQQNPLWQVSLDDANQTNVYIDGSLGRVIAHINNDKRLFDFMLMLHFMDYFGTGGFNHWLIISFAIGTLLLSMTGLTWLLSLFKNGMLTIKFSKAKQSITLKTATEANASNLFLTKHATVLDGLAEKHIFLPSSCGGGGTCGKCVFKTSAQIKVTASEYEHLSQAQLEQGYRLGCQQKVVDLTHLDISAQTSAQQHELVVTHSQFISPFVKEVSFALTSGQALDYAAGAYMQFVIPKANNKLRPADIPEGFLGYWQDVKDKTYTHAGGLRNYSILNYAQESQSLRFNVRWQLTKNGEYGGIGSGYLGGLAVGDKILARGPFSEFFATNSLTNQRFFIGAGLGLAPLRSIIYEQIYRLKQTNPITLIYGASNQDSLLYHTELQALEQQNPHFTYLPTLSSPTKAWSGHKGYVQVLLKALLEQGIERSTCEFYLCGPQAMMQEVEQLLADFGIHKSRIFKDSFSR
ncbi:PepSY domain-containing protein [Paraglaciecola aestuariivivens]